MIILLKLICNVCVDRGSLMGGFTFAGICLKCSAHSESVIKSSDILQSFVQYMNLHADTYGGRK